MVRVALGSESNFTDVAVIVVAGEPLPSASTNSPTTGVKLVNVVNPVVVTLK